jgi:hypothetical protein
LLIGGVISVRAFSADSPVEPKRERA